MWASGSTALLALNLGTGKTSAERTGGCVAPTDSLEVLKRGEPLFFAGDQKATYVSLSPWSSHSTMRDFRLPLDP
jgi:hypothetical protein